jgi:hypothetical protein
LVQEVLGLSKTFTKLTLIPVALITVLGAQSQAQPYKACLAKAFLKIEPGQKIEIIDHAGQSICEHLQKIDLEKPTITISQVMLQTERLKSPPLTVNSKDIAEIKYRKGQKSKRPLMLGLCSGCALGMIVGIQISEEKKSTIPFTMFEGTEYIPISMAAGAGAGLLLGAIISALIPTECATIECEL